MSLSKYIIFLTLGLGSVSTFISWLYDIDLGFKVAMVSGITFFLAFFICLIIEHNSEGEV